MNIFITTLGRLNDQKTLRNLSPNLRKKTMLVVQEHEYEAHLSKYGSQVRVMCLHPEINNLGPTRRFMHEYAQTHNLGSYILLDDDLDFYVRLDPDDWHLTTPDHKNMDRIFAEVQQKLDEGYMHVGVSGREGNNRIAEYGVETTRYMRLLGYRTDTPAGVEFGRIDGMSDFDVNVQLLRAGCASYVFFRYAQGQSGTQTPGGCELTRTHETHEREVDFMVAQHAPHVKKRMKKNKGGGAFGTRPEVTIYWKKALAEGESK